MTLIESIRREWGWIGLRPDLIVADNPFGHLIIRDEDGCYWWLRPEDLCCEMVASDRAGLDAVLGDAAFLRAWELGALVAEARVRFGNLRPGYRYALMVPAVLGGERGGPNLATLPLLELVGVSGEMARQIHDLPDGAHARLLVGD